LARRIVKTSLGPGTPDRSKQLFVLEKQDLIGATGSVWAASGATNAEGWRRDV
jgi:hypothetical protein